MSFAAALAAKRASFSVCSRCSLKVRLSCLTRAVSACSCDHAAQPVLSEVTGNMAMQSTGQGGTHKSQPVQSSAITVCICFAAPTMASTGQACIQSVQPMQALSSITATGRARSMP